MTTPDEAVDRQIARLEAELAPTLRDFRSASTAFAEREQFLLPSHRTTGSLTHWQTRNWKPKIGYRRWLLTVTTVCALVLFAVMLRSFTTMAPRVASSGSIAAPTTAQTTNLSDDALLETVATDLNTSVPTPLQSLAPPQTTSTTSTVTQ